MPQIFFDMDGVLANFVSGALRLHEVYLDMIDVEWDIAEQIGFHGDAKKHFWGPMGKDFWANLDVHEDGVQLLRMFEKIAGKDQIAFLTHACETPGCTDGKKEWVHRHFPEYSSRLIVVQGSCKHFMAGPDKYLIDDHDKNVSDFIVAGGMGFLVPRPWNAAKSSCDKLGRFDPEQEFEALKEMIIRS